MNRTLVHEGGPLNARVYRVEAADGGIWIEKDFSECPRLVRNTLGRFLVWRECWILRRLSSTGIVPCGVRRVSPFVLREDFCAGITLRAARKTPPPRDDGDPDPRHLVPRSFLEALEDGIKAVHAAGFVHLDLHNYRNVLVGPGWKPVLLDWQSALPTSWMPSSLRRALERVDLAGVCKFWHKLRPGELDESRVKFLERSRFLRRHFWIPRIHRRPERRPDAGASPR